VSKTIPTIATGAFSDLAAAAFGAPCALLGGTAASAFGEALLRVMGQRQD